MFKKKPEPEPATVACSKCGHIVLESRASYTIRDYGKCWYCSDHRPLYDECYRNYSPSGTSYVYYRRMRVDISGEPIGYAKIQIQAPSLSVKE